jgi:hypothetical protein
MKAIVRRGKSVVSMSALGQLRRRLNVTRQPLFSFSDAGPM